MSANERLRRLVAEEFDDCREADVGRRMDELASLDESVPADVDRDRAALRALGDETRYRIVYLLDAADGDLCVCEFDPLLDVSESAVSHALSDLADAGLVERRKEGTWRYYRTTERAEALVDALDATRGGTA